jgi:hypothetical protein
MINTDNEVEMMNHAVDLATMFESVSKNMENKFDEICKVMSHPSEKGGGIEEAFRKFLHDYFPKSLKISKGFVFDSYGKMSDQLDVIISDATNTPIFYQDDTGTQIVPVECVYAVIEVKTTLDGRELKKAFQNMESVRTLKKKAFVKDVPPYDNISVDMYGEYFDIWPINYFVFSIDSIDLQNLKRIMKEKYDNERLPPKKRIDTTCVLKKGVICNEYSDKDIGALPTEDSVIFTYNTTNAGRALLLFYTLITSTLFQARMPPFRLHEYIEKIL